MATYNAAMGQPRRPHDQTDSFSLQELADQTGLEARTIRSYVERGLVAGPDSMGRGARYPRETFDRLRVLQLLRDANRDVTLDQLRVVLHSLSPKQVRAIADGSLRIGALIDTEGPKANPTAPGGTAGPADPGDALSYLRSLKGLARTRPTAPADFVTDAATSDPLRVEEPIAGYAQNPALPDPDLNVLANAAQALAALVGLSASARSVRGEAWYRLALTPDLELSVRGDYGPEELAQLHRIADALRILLTRGTSR